MKLLLSLAVVFLVLAEVFCEEMSSDDDLNYWTRSKELQDDWFPAGQFQEILRRMTRKPRPHQFFGLMGKRSSAANAQMTRKRHKLNSFVGLMGKRSQEEPDSYDWSRTDEEYQRR
ncbi:protachykinin-1 [Anguilla rostrata]|uniref:Tachykinin domain-containing protein n=1 Tax=Anguilla anguilla TaxID=7936 RepID=A0A9D3M7N2_ANGAN|nr:protachykinin-1 [Anguilla anguilla]KAG5843082.1 hypothetical protein ANANG_G00184710 [Anguilla anguilla]